jgi:hypothetical protein
MPHRRTETIGTAVLPFEQAVSHKIRSLLSKHNIRIIHDPVKKTNQMLRQIKNKLDLNVSGIYRMPCERGKVCIGQTGRSIGTRCKEHMRFMRLSEKSAVAEHRAQH